jgi:hypothetical protein
MGARRNGALYTPWSYKTTEEDTMSETVTSEEHHVTEKVVDQVEIGKQVFSLCPVTEHIQKQR